MAVTQTELAGYLRLPPDSTENLDLFLDAARAKARAAGIPEFENNAQYDLLLLSLAGFYYENRSLGFSGVSQVAEVSMRRLLNSFVLELRHSEDSASDESGDSP